MSKRIVLQHTVGPLAGLWRIVGTSEHLPEGPLPSTIEDIDFGDHRGVCGLITTKPRYALYRELITPEAVPLAAPSFHPSQR